MPPGDAVNSALKELREDQKSSAAEIKEAIADLCNELRQYYVQKGEYTEWQKNVEWKLNDLRSTADRQEQARATDRRLILTSFIGPVVVGLLLLVAKASGIG